MSEGVSVALIAVSVWLTPQPAFSRGLLVNYGSQQTVEDLAWFHGYDLAPYPDRCGLASISPAHLGQIAWVRTDGGWAGPCLVVDVMARHHFFTGVYVNREVAEVPRWLAARLGFENGAQGEVWFGRCAPQIGALEARAYAPPLVYDRGDTQPLFWPYPAQEFPSECPSYQWN